MNSYIKSAKQLHYTYITNDCPVKTGVYHELCAKFGILSHHDNTFFGEYFAAWPTREGFAIYWLNNKVELDGQSKELFLADMVDLHNSYVITTSVDVARKFKEMCGIKPELVLSHDEHTVAMCDSGGNVSTWSDCSDPTIKSLTAGKAGLPESFINAMYDEMIKNEKLNKEYKEKMNTENKGTIKPNNTKIDYVPVTDSIFDLRDDFRKGLLFASKGRAVPEKITCTLDLAKALNAGDCLRAVERQTTWQEQIDLFVVGASASALIGGRVGFYLEAGIDNFTINGSISHQNFLELCRVALRATGELDAAQ